MIVPSGAAPIRFILPHKSPARCRAGAAIMGTGVEFSVSAYMEQMNNYRAIVTDLITALPAQQLEVQAFFGAKFLEQLESMALIPGSH
jgi:hypothetical protein